MHYEYSRSQLTSGFVTSSVFDFGDGLGLSAVCLSAGFCFLAFDGPATSLSSLRSSEPCGNIEISQRSTHRRYKRVLSYDGLTNLSNDATISFVRLNCSDVRIVSRLYATSVDFLTDNFLFLLTAV